MHYRELSNFKVPQGIVLAALGLLCSCNTPVQNMSFVSDDKRHWVAMDQLPPAPGGDELLPTLRLTLQDRWHSRGPVVLEGLETLCGTQVTWLDNANLQLRVPADRVFAIRVHEGDHWQGLTLHVQVHEDQVKLERVSADKQRRLLIIANCESGGWNLFLRRAGEPSFNEAMREGWNDPDLFGGFDENQPALALQWTGPRSAEIEVPGKRYGVTLRDRIGDVTLKWRFIKKFKLPDSHFSTLEPLPQ